MRFNSFQRSLTCAALILGLSFLCRPATAALVFTNTMRAEFDVIITPGGPLDGSGLPVGVPLPFLAQGELLFELDDTNPTATTRNFLNVSGTLPGLSPITNYSISPFEFVGGSLANIQYDASNQIVGGDITDLRMRFNMILNGGQADEARFDSVEPMAFDGRINGTPFAEFDRLAGPTNLFDSVRLRLPDGSLGPEGFTVSNRFLVAVPEPSSGLAVVVCAIAGSFVRRRKA